MKTNKTQAVLLMYQTLVEKGQLQKSEILERLTINSLTFKRYISELRCFFANFDPIHDVVYDRKSDSYLFVKAN
jgi:predicted DNA-binding transcriptional regulator YafY